MKVILKRDGKKVRLWGKFDNEPEDIIKDLIKTLPHREAIISDLDAGIENLKFIKYGDIDPESIEYESDLIKK